MLTQEEDVLDEYDEEGSNPLVDRDGKIDEECNVVIQDDDNGSFMPLSHMDGSFENGSTPRDEDEYEELPSVEEEQHITITGGNEEIKSPDMISKV